VLTLRSASKPPLIPKPNLGLGTNSFFLSGYLLILVFGTVQTYIVQCVNRILMKMWDEMAEMCLQNLEPKDFVYVSGRLGSFKKDLKTYYEVQKLILLFFPPFFLGLTDIAKIMIFGCILGDYNCLSLRLKTDLVRVF
jgi:hypothetical protein